MGELIVPGLTPEADRGAGLDNLQTPGDRMERLSESILEQARQKLPTDSNTEQATVRLEDPTSHESCIVSQMQGGQIIDLSFEKNGTWDMYSIGVGEGPGETVIYDDQIARTATADGTAIPAADHQPLASLEEAQEIHRLLSDRCRPLG